MPEVAELTLWEASAEGVVDDWGEVVTRYPYGNVRLDHLLSRSTMMRDCRFALLFFIWLVRVT